MSSVRHKTAVVVFLLIAGIATFAFIKSAQESSLDIGVNAATSFPKSYRLILDSVNEPLGTAHVEVRLAYYKDGLALWKPEMKEAHVQFTPLQIIDLAQSFDSLGLAETQFVATTTAENTAPTNNYSDTVPTAVTTDIHLIGNPKWYPFDDYLLLGKIDCDALATIDGKNYEHVPGNSYVFESNVEGFIVRQADKGTLENWNSGVKKILAATNNSKLGATMRAAEDLSGPYNANLWSKDGSFAFDLERPFFLRFFAGLLAIAAVLWVVHIFTVSDPKELSLNVLGYFIALWALREPLAAGEPKMPTVIDYSVMLLYALVVAIVLAKFIWGLNKQSTKL